MNPLRPVVIDTKALTYRVYSRPSSLFKPRLIASYEPEPGVSPTAQEIEFIRTADEGEAQA